MFSTLCSTSTMQAFVLAGTTRGTVLKREGPRDVAFERVSVHTMLSHMGHGNQKQSRSEIYLVRTGPMDHRTDYFEFELWHYTTTRTAGQVLSKIWI